MCLHTHYESSYELFFLEIKEQSLRVNNKILGVYGLPDVYLGTCNCWLILTVVIHCILNDDDT